MTDPARLRQERIRERPPQASPRTPERHFPGGGGAAGIGTWVVLRYRSDTILRVQNVEYIDNPPVQDATRAFGEFRRVYPPPGVQYGQFSQAFVRPLIDPLTSLTIENNPDPTKPEELYQAELEAWDRAMGPEAQPLRSVFYPFLTIPHAGVEVLVTFLWMPANVTFYNEQQPMSEGSSA